MDCCCAPFTELGIAWSELVNTRGDVSSETSVRYRGRSAEQGRQPRVQGMPGFALRAWSAAKTGSKFPREVLHEPTHNP